MYIDYENVGRILGFGKDFFYNLKVRQNLNYIKKNQKRVLKNLKGKTPLNVVFYVYDETKWKSQSVYDLMEKDERFNPLVVVTKNCAQEGNANYQTEENVKRCYDFFKNKGMNVEYGYIKNPCDEDKSFIPFKTFNPDLIFYSHPWYVYKTQGPVMCSEFALTYYIPYFLPASEQWHEFGLRFHKYLYRHFVPSDLIKDFYSQKGGCKNLKTVGHPIFDLYNTSEKEEKKYIIYAPHWTVTGDNLRFGTFEWSGKRILEFAKEHKDLNWVFRPHPLFYNFILTSNYMQKEEIDNYFNEWENIGICSLGGDYTDFFKKSYAMITDCGSFLTEYFVTENPVIHLLSENFKHNPLTQKIDETYYTAHNTEELNTYLEDVILNQNDYKKENRSALADELDLKNTRSSERIINDICSDL